MDNKLNQNLESIGLKVPKCVGSTSGEDDSGESGVESNDEGHLQIQNSIESSESSDSESSGSSTDENQAEEQLHFTPMLSAVSVKIMTQSVDCPVEGHVASALGHLAIKRLRRILLVANQIRKHHNSIGLETKHFTEAEKLCDSVTSFGHLSLFEQPKFIYISNGISTYADPALIDLHNTFESTREKPMKISKITNVRLNEHHFNYSYGSETFSTTKNVQQRNIATNSCSISSENSIPVQENMLLLEKLIEKVLVLNDEDVPAYNDVISGQLLPKFTPLVGIEWIDYIKVFINAFFTPEKNIFTETKSKNHPKTNHNQHQKPYNGKIHSKSDKKSVRNSNLDLTEKDFTNLVADLSSHGNFIIFNLLLKFFIDYIEKKLVPITKTGISRILIVLENVLKRPNQMDLFYLKRIFKILVMLISLNIFPEIHRKLGNVVALLIQKGNKEFSIEFCVWIVKYVEESLENCASTCLQNLKYTLNSLNLVLNLIISLENIGVSVLLNVFPIVIEIIDGLFNIHNESVLENDRNDHEAFKFNEYLDETLLIIFGLIMKKYVGRISYENLEKFQSILIREYAQKLIPCISTPEFYSSVVDRKRKISPVINSFNSIYGGAFPKRRLIQWGSKQYLIGKIYSKKTNC